METTEQLWLKSTKVMVDKVILMLRDVYMRGGYGDSLDLNGIEKLTKNLFQKLTEYTNEIVKLKQDKESGSKLIVEYKTKLEAYDKVFEEFSPANQKVITKIKERVEQECKSQQ
jgi:hypothetical protein